jgi:FtsP/CotA-like multicopper oxidase with cupredoxin domain
MTIPVIQPFQDELPVPQVLRLDRDTDPTECRLTLRNKLVQLHSALHAVTPVWCYDVFDVAKNQWLCDPQNYLGPTLMVRSGRRVVVTYENAVKDILPMTALRVGLHDSFPGVDPLTANRPGKTTGFIINDPNCSLGKILPDTSTVPGTDKLFAWAVTHLHGGRTAAMYDGWTENAMLPPRSAPDDPKETLPGQTQVSVYENQQRACLLWYHDHGMGITRFNVFSGLAGAYVIRDPDEEQRLRQANIFLPEGCYDVPLVIQDRNLDGEFGGAGSDDGKPESVKLNGRLLHKVTDATGEFFGPYTLVNGVIWPKMCVERRRYRLRLLNGSNARTYCLKLVAYSDGMSKDPTEIPLDSMVRQIGTDGGLLAAPVKIPAGSSVPPVDPKKPLTNGLVLASAERADLFVDFSKAPEGVTRIALVNTAFAPFHRFTVQNPDTTTNPGTVENDPTSGSPVQSAPALPAGTALPGMRLAFPNVMCFDLGAVPASDPATDLLTDPPVQFGPGGVGQKAWLGPVSHDDVPKGHGHRMVMLVESPPGMLMLNEMAIVDPNQAGRFIPLADGGPIAVQDAAQNNKITTYVPLATRFEDRVTFFVPYGQWEVWQILNLTVDTHPFHVHLVQFKVLARQQVDPDSFSNASFSPMAGITAMNPILLQARMPPDANEAGWKDTVRVNPGEMVVIAAQFIGFTGRYMYHCHILEHEDHDMMRPFIVIPSPAMNVMDAMGDMPMLDGMMGMPMANGMKKEMRMGKK